MQYKDLTANEKAILEGIEGFFLRHHSIRRGNFLRVLQVLIRKYGGVR